MSDMPEWMDRTMKMSISEFMDGAQVVKASASPSEVAQALGLSPAHVALVVSDDTAELLGIVTPADLVKLTTAKSALEVATTFPVAVNNNAQLWQALQLMNGDNSQGKTVNVLPVVDSERNPQGVLVRSRLKIQLDKMSF